MNRPPDGFLSDIPPAIAAFSRALVHAFLKLTLRIGQGVARASRYACSLVARFARGIWSAYSKLESRISALVADLLLTTFALRYLAAIVGAGVALGWLRLWLPLALYVLFVASALLLYFRPDNQDAEEALKAHRRHRIWLTPIVQWALRLTVAASLAYLTYGPLVPSMFRPVEDTASDMTVEATKPTLRQVVAPPEKEPAATALQTTETIEPAKHLPRTQLEPAVSPKSGQPTAQPPTASPAPPLTPILSAKRSFAYVMKAYGYPYDGDLFLERYLERFDEAFDDYDDNEFELRKRREKARLEISDLVNSVKYETIFTREQRAVFGDYDFQRESFAFEPFSLSEFREGYPTFYLFNFPSFLKWSNDTDSVSNIYVSNFRDFVSLPMSQADAEAFIRRRRGSDREVRIRYYYSMRSDRVQDRRQDYTIDRGLYCHVYLVEVWDDRGARQRIATVTATTNPPAYLQESRRQIESGRLGAVRTPPDQ